MYVLFDARYYTDNRSSEKDNIDRPRLIDDGKMAKGSSPQSGHDIPYFTKVRDFLMESTQPLTSALNGDTR